MDITLLVDRMGLAPGPNTLIPLCRMSITKPIEFVPVLHLSGSRYFILFSFGTALPGCVTPVPIITRDDIDDAEEGGPLVSFSWRNVALLTMPIVYDRLVPVPMPENLDSLSGINIISREGRIVVSLVV